MRTRDIKAGQTLTLTHAGKTITVKPITTNRYGVDGVYTINTRLYNWAWSNDAIDAQWMQTRKHLLRAADMEGKDCEFPEVFIKNAVAVRSGNTMLLVNPAHLTA
jgi:hypothetical protein